MHGYECPCGHAVSNEDEEALTREAWAHARVCEHEDHVAARRDDPTYGHPNHFFYDRSGS
jgi:hypothetical protein